MKPKPQLQYRGFCNEPHSCGFLEDLLAQPFYGWGKRRPDFLRGLSASFSWLALADFVATAKAQAQEAR
jgi:hypothetical protein